MCFAHHQPSLRIQAIVKQKCQEKNNMGCKELTDLKKLNPDVENMVYHTLYLMSERKSAK